MIKREFLIIILFVIICPLWGESHPENEESFFSFSVMPGFIIPIGTYSDIFEPGGGVTLGLKFNLPPLPSFPALPLFLRCSGTYDFVPLTGGLDISVLTLGLVGGADIILFPGIQLEPYAGGGYFYSFLNENFQYFGAHPYGIIGIESTFTLFKNLTIGINAGYRHFFGFSDDLFFSINASISFPGTKKGVIDSSLLTFKDIFPVLFNYYRDNPVGSLSIQSNSPQPIVIKKISLQIDGYSTEPWTLLLNREVNNRTNVDFELFAQFRENILDIEHEQDTKAKVLVEYMAGGKMKNTEFSSTMHFYPGNMIKKENPEQLSAFITNNDPDIIKFTEPLKKTIVEYEQADIIPNIFIALGVYNAVKVYGINVKKMQNSDMMFESIQFPGTTIKEKYGDSLDLAILFCTLLDSLDVDTALIQTHDDYIIAFSLNSDPKSIMENYINLDNIIVVKNSTWIPFAFTSGEKDFFQAVEQGAEKWKENNETDQVLFFPVDELKEMYSGLDMSGDTLMSGIDPPKEEELKKQYRQDLNRYYVQDSIPKPSLPDIASDNDNADTRLYNNRAVIYAKYTFYDKAMTLLNNILLHEDYVPALVNMGNIYFLLNEMKKARAYFERAYEKDPIHPVILLSLARVNFALENYGNVKESFRKLLSIDPELALEYAYLELSGENAIKQAEKAEQNQRVIWIEE